MEILFKDKLSSFIGVELEGVLSCPVSLRECACANKRMVNTLNDCLALKGMSAQVSPEASAAQIEAKTSPLVTHKVVKELGILINLTKDAIYNNFNLKWVLKPYASYNLDLYFYPDEPRYRTIFAGIDNELRRFVMSAMALHIHIGCKDKTAALRVYNMLAQDINNLIRIDFGGRLEKYIKMIPCAIPKKYSSWQDFERDAKERGFQQNTSNNHSLIRITKHGTVELRMFNSSEDLERISKLIKYIERYSVWA